MPAHRPPASAELLGNEDEFGLLRVIDAVRADRERIVEKVALRRRLLGEQTGLSGRALADELARELIQDAKLRSAVIGAGFALPWAIPVIGFWGSLAFTIIGAAIWQLANEVELVYELAEVYGSRLDAAQLRMTSFWLVQLTNFDDLRGRAMDIGVNLTVRKLVQKLISVGLARAYGATAHSLMMARAVGGTPTQPWYLRATEYIGVPVLFYFGWKSTSGVGQRASEYFREEVGFQVIEGGAA